MWPDGPGASQRTLGCHPSIRFLYRVFSIIFGRSHVPLVSILLLALCVVLQAAVAPVDRNARWAVQRNGRYVKKARASGSEEIVPRSVAQITDAGSMVLAVRRNIGNVASCAVGALILEDLSGQTVRRCEEHGSSARARGCKLRCFFLPSASCTKVPVRNINIQTYSKVRQPLCRLCSICRCLRLAKHSANVQGLSCSFRFWSGAIVFARHV